MGNQLMDLWSKTQKFPLGGTLFNLAIAFKVPYTGTISPSVVVLEPGHAVVTMKDKRKHRNHLRSIHAIAQMNLAEFVTGLAMSAQLPKESRAIITGLSIEFVKKARGVLTAECHCPPVTKATNGTFQIEGVVRDAGGDVVSRAKADWLIGPK